MAGLFSRAAARRRKRPPGRARSPAMSQPGGQWQFAVEGGTGYQPVLAGDSLANRMPGQWSASCRPQRAGRPFHPAKTQPGGQWQFGVDERGERTRPVLLDCGFRSFLVSKQN